MLQRHRGRQERLPVVNKDCTVFSSLDHHGSRTHRVNGACRLHKVRGVRKAPGLILIHKHNIDLPDDLSQLLAAPLYPEIHRIESNELWTGPHLFQDIELKRRCDIRQE